MEWLQSNWFWVLILVVFIGAHLFGHGGHGGHEGHGRRDDRKPPAGEGDDEKRRPAGHQH